ncbi:MAG: hypothetical protein WKG07_19170 [Hymenobacter sp.]
MAALGRDLQGNAGATGPLGEISTQTVGSTFVVQFNNFQPGQGRPTRATTSTFKSG